MDDLNLKITPEELMEHSKNIVKETMHIRELIAQIEDSIEALSDWQSENKEGFVNNVREDIKDMTAMVEAAESYGMVGGDVAARVLGVENAIKDEIMKKQA